MSTSPRGRWNEVCTLYGAASTPGSIRAADQTWRIFNQKNFPCRKMPVRGGSAAGTFQGYPQSTYRVMIDAVLPLARAKQAIYIGPNPPDVMNNQIPGFWGEVLSAEIVNNQYTSLQVRQNI